MDKIVEYFFVLLPFFGTVIVSGSLLWFVYWVLIARHPEIEKEKKFPLQIIILFLIIASLLAIVISLPIPESSRNKIIGIIGILLSGIIAFASTNVISNFMAGLLLRITQPFRTGDFIRVGEYFGRVSNRGLFDTEIQSPTRELIALPNTYLINTPVTTTRTSGAIVSVTLSIGYDVHHSQIEDLLIQAAQKTGLSEPFVNITELGNYAISYKLSGLLTDVKSMITTRSNLFRSVLDTLHEEGIEIMSPNFMSQRKIPETEKMIPTVTSNKKLKQVEAEAEDIVFDKAEQAEKNEDKKQNIIEKIDKLEESIKESDKEEKEKLKEKLQDKKESLKLLKEEPEEPES